MRAVLIRGFVAFDCLMPVDGARFRLTKTGVRRARGLKTGGDCMQTNIHYITALHLHQR